MTHEHDERCREYFEKLSELIDGEMDEVTAARIRAHLESCPECRVCWTTFQKSVEVFRNIGEAPLSEGALDELKNIIRNAAK